MRTTAVRVSAVLASVLVFLLSVACKDAGPAGVTAVWQYDEARTVLRAESGGAALKAKLAGMTIDLQFRSDNSYSLSIKGGPAPISAEGTFKTKFGGMVLSKTVVDGKPVTPSDLHLKSPTRDALELSVDGYTVLLKQR